MWESSCSNSLLLDVFPSHFLVSGFGFHPVNIIFWVGHMVKKNGKESMLKKKKIQWNKGYPLYKK